MTIIHSLIREFKNEAQTTRKHLERLPSDKLDWRPHEKPFTAGGLSSHIVKVITPLIVVGLRASDQRQQR